MGRKASFSGSTKPLTAAIVQQISFTPTDIESAGLVIVEVGFFGTTNPITNASIDRFRLRAGGDVIFDCTLTQLQAFQQRWANRFTAAAAAARQISVPLCFLDAPRGMAGEQQDRCQFPPNREIQVEILMGSGTAIPAGGGSAMLTWKQTDRTAEFFPRYYTNVLNIAAGARNGKYTFAEPGIVRGFTLPTVGVDRAELYISDRLAWRLPGPTFGGGVALNQPDLLTEKDFFEDGTTIADPKCHSVDLVMPAAGGSSYLTLDTTSGGASPWAGATNEGAIYAVVPLAG